MQCLDLNCKPMHLNAVVPGAVLYVTGDMLDGILSLKHIKNHQLNRTLQTTLIVDFNLLLTAYSIRSKLVMSTWVLFHSQDCFNRPWRPFVTFSTGILTFYVTQQELS